MFSGFVGVFIRYGESGEKVENNSSNDRVVLVVFFPSGLASIVSSVDKLMQSLSSSSFLWGDVFCCCDNWGGLFGNGSALLR